MGKRRAKGEGSVHRLKTGPNAGKWVSQVSEGRGPDGKRKRTTYYGDSQAEVLAAIRKARKKLDRGVALTSDRLTVSAYLSRWLVLKAGHLAARTMRSYRDNVRLHISPALGSVPLAKLVRSQVQEFADAKAADPTLSPRTAEYLVAILRSALGDAVADRTIEYNAAANVNVDVPVYEPDPFTPEEALTFLEAVKDHRWLAMYVVAITTGLREGEILGLHWPDVDTEARVLHVRRQLQRIEKKFVLLDKPKTTESKGVVPLGDLALAALDGHRARQREARLAAGKLWAATGTPEGWPIFTTRHGKFLHERTVLAEFQRILDRAGIRKRTFHDLRHSAASIANALGASMKDVSALLRHSSVKITMDTYTKVFAKARHELAGKFDEALGRKR